MATCDYCGATYRGGAIKDGSYRYVRDFAIQEGKHC